MNRKDLAILNGLVARKVYLLGMVATADPFGFGLTVEANILHTELEGVCKALDELGWQPEK